MEIVLNNDLSCHVHDTRKRSCDENVQSLIQDKYLENIVTFHHIIVEQIGSLSTLPVRNPILKNKKGTLGATEVSTKETLKPSDESIVINRDPNLSNNGGKNGPKGMLKNKIKDL